MSAEASTNSRSSIQLITSTRSVITGPGIARRPRLVRPTTAAVAAAAAVAVATRLRLKRRRLEPRRKRQRRSGARGGLRQNGPHFPWWVIFAADIWVFRHAPFPMAACCE